jgi:hypothetical protein
MLGHRCETNYSAHTHRVLLLLLLLLLLQGMGRSLAAECRGSKSRIKYTKTTMVWSMFE